MKIFCIQYRYDDKVDAPELYLLEKEARDRWLALYDAYVENNEDLPTDQFGVIVARENVQECDSFGTASNSEEWLFTPVWVTINGQQESVRAQPVTRGVRRSS